MKKYYIVILFATIALKACSKDDSPVRPKGRGIIVHEEANAQKPFPQALSFKNGIKPDNLSQDEMNAAVKLYYESWLKSYVWESNGQTPGGGYYVRMKGTGGDGTEITTSEAHGYGMIIFALMAGYDADAKKYFDGMLNMFYQHYSSGNSKCMSWVIHESEKGEHRQGSATDGDMDIAYALLLAHKQWGSEGVVNYLQMARDVITGLKESCVASSTKRMLLGDWDTDQYSTRSSDWMTGHMRCFYEVTNDELWLEVADEVYAMISQLSQSHSLYTGLMPDFVVGNAPRPAPEYFLNEYQQTNQYSWNACRYPWRITADYLHFGTHEAKASMKKLVDFFISDTNGNPSEIKAGYLLTGRAMVHYSSGAYMAPVVTASMVDNNYQEFLNDGWAEIQLVKESYYSDTICLLNMLLISGNWWNPVQ